MDDRWVGGFVVVDLWWLLGWWVGREWYMYLFICICKCKCKTTTTTKNKKEKEKESQ